MCLKIYASEQIEKKGKISVEEILKNIKEEEELHPSPKKIENNIINNNHNHNNNLIKDWDIINNNDMNKKVDNNYPNQNKTDSKSVAPVKKKKKGCCIF